MKDYPLTIDLNCDMGESYGNFKVGNDTLLFPYISSCNIACGFHGGDPLTIQQTIQTALKYNVQIGAHPSFPDLMGFGRQKMQFSKSALKAIVKYQIAAVKGLTESEGGVLKYVKPHGALYNLAAESEAEALAIVEAIYEIDNNLALLGMAESAMEITAKKIGIPFIAEAFADRRYTKDKQLLSRQIDGAVLHHVEDVVVQVLELLQNQRVLTNEQEYIYLNAQSICVHGDNVMALNILQAIDVAFQQHGIEKQAFRII